MALGKECHRIRNEVAGPIPSPAYRPRPNPSPEPPRRTPTVNEEEPVGR